MGEANLDNEEEKWIMHYSSLHKILLVGEGDFSFAVCLAKAFGSAKNMVATSLDSEGMLMQKYTSARANLQELRDRECTILHEVDGHTMNQHPLLHLRLRHRHVVKGFLRSASDMLTENGEVHVTHKTAHPFNRWEIEKLAEEVGLCLAEKVRFYKWDYPGYDNKRGDGYQCNQNFPVGECTTFKFSKPSHDATISLSSVCDLMSLPSV